MITQTVTITQNASPNIIIGRREKGTTITSSANGAASGYQ